MPRILLVEDDPLISEIYMKKFQTSGFDVVNVTTGKAVLTTIEHDPKFDLVLLDLVLPEMGGMEVLKELRTDPKYPAELKVIIFSNLSDPEDRKRAVEYRANGFIQKTEYTPSRLVEEGGRLIGQFAEQKKNVTRIAEKQDVPKGNGKRILFIEAGGHRAYQVRRPDETHSHLPSLGVARAAGDGGTREFGGRLPGISQDADHADGTRPRGQSGLRREIIFA